MKPIAADEPTASTDPFKPARPAVIAQPGEGMAVRAFGNEIRFQLTSEQSGGALNVGLATVPVGARVPPHIQTREEELFLIIEGRYRFSINGEWKEVAPGGMVYIPRGVAHTFEVLGEQPGRHWVLMSPGGFDRFYARCAELFAQPGPPDFSRLPAINAEFGIRMV
jgi:quercetin dioxygenase-like cupin family protein